MTHPVRSRRDRRDSTDPSMMRFKAPPHPVAELQGPFEESMAEAAGWEESEVPSDAASRRTLLLDAPTYERVIAGRWKQKLGEKYHPLWKLIAQLSFGIHLLAEGLAKSEDDVMQILQTHIDDIDLFLERTTEDLTLGQEDIQERLRCLQLPLQHPKVFDRMLEDKAFRSSIVDGNEKIEHIVARTGCAMKDSLKDAQKGLDATGALERYMASLEDSWMRQNAEQDAVYSAMLENVEGWRQAFVNLHTQGDALGSLLKQLTEVINQMQQRAGEVSRRLIRAQQKQGHVSTASNSITYIARQSASSPSSNRSATPERSSRKPLPGVPSRTAPIASKETSQGHPRASRPPTNQSHRSETAQSNRSASSQLAEDLRSLRNPSREGVRSSVRDSHRSSTNSRAPRLVEIKRNSPLNASHIIPALSTKTSQNDLSSSLPAELPAEHSGPGNGMGSTPSLNGMDTGLGIVPGLPKATTGTGIDGSALALVGLTNEFTGADRLPMTPSSMFSNPGTRSTLVHELESQSVTPHLLAPTLPFAKENSGTPFESPPTTPSWAKQTFELEGRDRGVSDKTAFRSHPPHAELGSPPILLPRTAYVQPQRNRQNQSAKSGTANLGPGPGPDPKVASSDHTGSVKSDSHDGSNTEISSVKPSESIVETESPPTSEMPTGAKVFAAELEGSTPVMLRPAVFQGIAAELEAPYEVKQSQSRVPTALAAAAGASTTSHDASSETTLDAFASASVSVSELSAVETRVAAAVRRSFIATNIELPGGPVEEMVSSIAQLDVQQSNTRQDRALETSDVATHLRDDSMVRSEAISEKVPGEKQERPRPARLENLNQRYVSSAQRSPALRKPVSAVASPTSSGQSPTTTGTPPHRGERSVRLSTASTASSQSQWRAFFKGQLSPAEFTASSPVLTSNPSVSSKITLDSQRRGQMISPTLGWQWAPMTPDTEELSRVVST